MAKLTKLTKPKVITAEGSLAEWVVDLLMTNGQGKKAHRLVLVDRDGHDLGGWGRQPAIEHIQASVRVMLKAYEAGVLAANGLPPRKCGHRA